MTCRTPLHLLFALLLLLAGPAGASHSDMPAPDAHCGDMDERMEKSLERTEMSMENDCDSQCTCCPGTCSSGAVVLTANAVPASPASTPRLAQSRAGAPYRLPARPLRPPISA